MGDGTTAPPPDGDAPRPRRRWLRVLVALAISLPFVLLAAVVVLVLALPTILTGDRVRDEAVSALTELLGSCVEIERVEYHPLGGVQLFGVELCPPEGFDRTPLSAARIAARYDLRGLLSRKVVIRELAIDTPHLVLETRGGRRNVDVLLARLSGEPKEEAPPSGPLRGPLSPIELTLERFAIGPTTVELDGEGPRVVLRGLSLEAHAELDPARLDARVELSIDPAAAPDRLNLALDLPPPAEGGPGLSARASVDFTATATLAAGASDGLSIEGAGLSSRLSVTAGVERGELRIPRTTTDLRLAFVLSPREDRAALQHVTLSVDGASLARAEVHADGLGALLDGALGSAAGAALGAQLGVVRGSGDGTVRLAVDHLAIPLTELAPLVAAVSPGTQVGGRIALAPILVEGTPAELAAGLPRGLEATLALTGVHVVDRARELTVREVSGRVLASRTGASQPIQLDGALAARGIVHPAASVESLAVELHAAAERLLWPLPGQTRAALSVAAIGVRAPAATIDRVSVTAGLSGEEVFSNEREGHAPVRADLGLELGHARVATGTSSLHLAGVRLGVSTAIDRLLAPSLRPIGAEAKLSVAEIALGDGTRVRGTNLDARGAVTDPRLGTDLDARLELTLGVGRAEAKRAVLGAIRAGAKLSAGGIAPRYLPDAPRSGPPAMLPANAGVELSVSLPEVTIDDPARGAVKTSVELSARGRADLVSGTASLDALSMTISDLIRLTASGSARRFLAPDRWIDAKLDVAPIELARLIAALPPAVFAGTSGLPTAGSVGLSLATRGVVPAELAELDLAAPPMEVDAAVRFSGIDLSLPAQKLGVEGVRGAIKLGVHRGRTELGSTVRVRQLRALEAGSPHVIEHLVLTSTAALRGDVWSLVVDADREPHAGALPEGGGEPAGSADLAVAVDVAYPRHGDLDIKRLEVRVPGAGVDVALYGGLLRRRFGVLRPSLSIKGRFDLDRLRAFIPAVGGASGVVGGELSIDSKLDTALDVRGVLEVDRLSLDLPGDGKSQPIAITEATGRIPFEQRIALPEPIMRELKAAARGNLGDDLEARLEELQNDLLELRAYLDADDILIEAPRAADYQALRPYLADTGARLTIARLSIGRDTLRDIALEALWRSGVFRVDRFAAALWEGDVLADIAVQVTADRNVRARIRATITDLNLDIPYAAARRIAPVSDPGQKDAYRVSGTLDFKFALKERSLNATIDMTKLRKPTVERFFGALDPRGTNDGIKNAQLALDMSESVGLRPIAGKIWISQNLMGLSLDWQRLPFLLQFKSPGEYFSSWVAPLGFFKDLSFVFLRPIMLVTAGSFVVNTVNNAFDKFSVSNVLEPVFAGLRLEEKLAILSGRVVSSGEGGEPTAARTGDP